MKTDADILEVDQEDKTAVSSPAGMDIAYDKELITPEAAEEILANRPHGEIADPKAVDAYARAMAAGGWILNGQPIIFDRDGALLDGVHRLAASVKAGVAFPTFVARNVRGDTLQTIEQHRRRRYSGVLEARLDDGKAFLDGDEACLPRTEVGEVRLDRVERDARHLRGRRVPRRRPFHPVLGIVLRTVAATAAQRGRGGVAGHRSPSRRKADRSFAFGPPRTRVFTVRPPLSGVKAVQY